MTEKTIAVRLYDDVPVENEKGGAATVVMNIAEVKVYEISKFSILVNMEF